MLQEKRRARRFDLSLPVQMMAVGDKKESRSVRTKDISSTGLFIEFDERVQTGTKVELMVTLPQEITQAGVVQIRCLGHVVRVDRGHDRMGIAVTIDRYEFARQEDSEAKGGVS